MDEPYEELFNRYDEETDILNDKNSLAVILFGSRVTDSYKIGSDLDILIITPDKDDEYSRMGRIIDGIRIEIIKISKEVLIDDIKSEVGENSTFYESVLFNGVVKKNKNLIVEEMKDIVEATKTKRKKRIMAKIPDYCEEILDQELYKYHHASDDAKQLYYYTFINYLRLVYAKMNNLSDVPEWICFDIYTNEEKAKRYKSSLPTQEFINSFIATLNPINMEESMKSLYHFVYYKDYLEDKRIVYIPKEYQRSLYKRDSERKLMYLGKIIYKVEDKLLLGTQDSSFVYFLLLDIMREIYMCIGPSEGNSFEEQFKVALSAVGSEERIHILEELLHTISFNYEFDFDDYTL